MDTTRRVKFSDENNENNSAYVNSILFDDNKVNKLLLRFDLQCYNRIIILGISY